MSKSVKVGCPVSMSLAQNLLALRNCSVTFWRAAGPDGIDKAVIAVVSRLSHSSAEVEGGNDTPFHS